jgi:hypothetical protein
MLKRHISRLLLALSLLLHGQMPAFGSEAKTGRTLQVVLMLGQNEMIGNGDIASLSYMLEQPVVPERDVTLNAHKAMLHQPNSAYLYWKAMQSYTGPDSKRKELAELLEERTRFKQEFKEQVIAELEANDGVFRGQTYAKRRGQYRGFWLFNLCDQECETVGLTPQIRTLLEAPENTFNVKAAYEQLQADATRRYERQQELIRLFLPSTSREDFDAYRAERIAQNQTAESNRQVHVQLANDSLHLPISQSTYIATLNSAEGSAAGGTDSSATGPLSIGYGNKTSTFGLEYGVGFALEKSMDAPVLIIKCAWNSSDTIDQAWRVSSSVDADSETNVEPGWAFTRSIAFIQEVLSDPGKYHPAYDATAGLELAGMIWYQGASEKDATLYADALTGVIRDIRKEFNANNLPVVLATAGRPFFQVESDAIPVNMGLRQVASMPDFADTVTVLDSYHWRASELSLLRGMIRKRKIIPSDDIKTVLQHAGTGPFYLMAGYEVGKQLFELIQTNP